MRVILFILFMTVSNIIRGPLLPPPFLHFRFLLLFFSLLPLLF